MSVHITLAESKSHLRVDFTDDDTYIQALCDLCEELILIEVQGTLYSTGTVTTNGTVNLVGIETYFTDYKAGDVVKVEGETNRTIVTITDDSHLTVDTAFSTSETRLVLTVYPGLPSPLPLGLHHAMLLMVGHYYQVREPIIIGVNTMKIPYAYEYLVAPYKNYTVA